MSTNALTEEERLIGVIERICPHKQTTGPFGGAVLTGVHGSDAIQALTRRDTYTIESVPVDTRYHSKQMLLHSIERPGIAGRRDLLSSAAFGGSGKTVLLSFNAYWFVQATRGIAVEVTFNKDQQGLDGFSNLRTIQEVETAIAVRIVHRLLATLNCPQNRADYECGSSGTVTVALKQTMAPLTTTINAARAILGAAQDTRFLLCIDELAKCIHSEADNFAMEDALQPFTARLDADKSFFLAVSALGAEAIVKLATGSNRRVLLQALGPLWFAEGFHPGSKPLLPPALRPFYEEEARALLPYDSSAMALYLQLTELVSTAAGHPRRLESLFNALRAFKPTAAAAPLLGEGDGGGDQATPAERRAAGRAFVTELAAWLNHVHGDPASPEFDKIQNALELLEMPTDLLKLVPGNLAMLQHLPLQKKDQLISDALEDLALYSACPFHLPRLPNDTNALKTVLWGISQGFCQLVPAHGTMAHAELLAYIPLPVLKLKHPRHLRPRGQALLALRSAILKMYTPCAPDQRGKDFEEATAAAMLLLARCRDTFTLSDLCGPGNAGTELDAVLLGGPDVLFLAVHNWPAMQGGPVTGEDVQGLVDQLIVSGAAGAIVAVDYKFNVPSDFYGIFRKEDGGFQLVRSQCKYWFKDRAEGTDIVRAWRKHDSKVPAEIEVIVDGVTIPVPCASLLFTANPLQQAVTLRPQEGVITIASMRRWLPTAAHALQMFTHLREIFGWWEQDERGQ